MVVRAWPWSAPSSAPFSTTKGGPLTVINRTDAELVEASLAGEREAFDLIVERHRRNVYQLCYRFVANQDDAADLAQDVFVRAFRGLRNFKGEASLGTWLYRIGVNVCLTRLRVKNTTSESLEPLFLANDERIAAPGESATEALLRGERQRRGRAPTARAPHKKRRPATPR